MHFANDYDIEWWAQRFAAHPILGSAAQTLRSLKDAVNGCSDGWAYWPAPVRSAHKLIELIEDADRVERRGATPQLAAADLDRAYRPIKAFTTRYRSKYGFDVAFHYPAAHPTAPEPLTLFA